jgi:predicted amidohydrolase YtcJ
MKADVIISGQAVFDGLNTEPYPGFVAVKDNKILAVEKGLDTLENYLDRNTRQIDAGDGLIMPAFFDSHTHLILAGMYQTCVNLGVSASEEEAAQMVKDYADRMPDLDWIIGFNWYHIFWENKKLPVKETLDRLIPDRPVLLVNAEAHGAWVNSEALRRAGIDKDTPDPIYGKIHRDSSGEATGILEEAALGLAGRIAFDFTPEQEKQYLRQYLRCAAESGITAVKDMQPYFGRNLGSLDVYRSMEKTGELTLRIHAAPDLLGDLQESIKLREQYQSPRIRVNHLKQFMDGVSTTHTALMLEDYADGPPGDKGSPLGDLDAIKDAVAAAHNHSFSVCLHSCGDRSARLALDYIEAAIKQHGPREVRHTIEHNELVDPSDIPRFRQLGVIPSVMPDHLAMTPTFDGTSYRVVMGEARASRMFALRSLYESTGVMAIGSDCPVVSQDPFLEIYRAVTRVHDDGEPAGGWTPEEKLTLYQVLRSYTYGSAYSAGVENDIGTLETNKLADIIILNQNLFQVPVGEIRKTKVSMTMMDGDVIHQL